MFTFNNRYFLLNCIFLSVLIFIAAFVHDQFVRPFLGDVIVVGWLYLFVRSFIKVNKFKIAHCVLLFSYSIEITQFYNLVSILGLEDIKIARIIIGSTFDWLDMLAYTIGWVVILIIEFKRDKS